MKETFEAWILILKPVKGVQTVYLSTDADLQLKATTLRTYPTRKVAIAAARLKHDLGVVPLKVSMIYSTPN